MSMSRRGALAAGAGLAAGAFLNDAPAFAQDSDDAAAFDWVHALGEMHVAAANEGAQVRGGTVYAQSLDAMVTAQVLTQEIASALPEFHGALYTQYLIPDPDNASGATFSNTFVLAIFRFASTDAAKAARSTLQDSWASRDDARKLTKEETGADGLSAYLIESSYAAAGGNVPANYVNGVSIYGDLVVYINGVAYDADPLPLLGALAQAARGQLRRVKLAGSTIGGLIFPEGQPESSIFVIVHKGQLIERFEESEQSREITGLIGDVDRVEYYYRVQFVAQPTAEGAPQLMFVQNHWRWGNPEDTEAFITRFQDIFAEIDPKQNVERVFVSPEEAGVASTEVVRARRHVMMQTVPPELYRFIGVSFFLWLIEEEVRVFGLEGYGGSEERFWSFGMVLLETVRGDEALEELVEDAIVEELPEKIKDWIEEETGVHPDDDPSIINDVTPSEWEDHWDDYYD
jgi:hypothetical protein